MKPLSLVFAAVLSGFAVSSPAAEKTLIDYFLPMPIRGALGSNLWGAPNVFPRDPHNGLEDPTMKQWCYWDGQIIQGTDQKFHLFASRWDQAKGHGGWWGSRAVHAVSENVVGPYLDAGLCWPDNQGGKGHNVTALGLPDGRYALVVSETRPGDVFVSKSLDGPWEPLGSIQVATNEFSKLGRMSNVSVLLRPDGDFMIVARSGAVWISKTGILGPYTVQVPSVYSTIPEMRSMHTLEDPVVWHSGGLYHIVVNDWNPRKAYHLTSPNGIDHWRFRGLAYDPTRDFLRYTDGTVNHWNKIERPGVLLQNGHVTHFTFAVLDVPKEQEKGNDTHGSKVIVVPFDGAALDRDLQAASNATSRGLSPQPVRSSPAGQAESRAPSFTYQNPLDFAYSYHDGVKERTIHELRDPAIIREGDTYYLTFTAFPFTHSDSRRADRPDYNSPPGIMLHSSMDLKHWKFERWLVKSSELPEACPYKHRFWAPEIHKIRNRFFLIFTADNWIRDTYNKGGKIGAYGAFVGVADKITGPYEHITWLPGAGCDSTLFQDDDGKTYAVMPFGDEFIQEVNLSGIARGDISLVGERKMIVARDNRDVGKQTSPDYLEGPWLIKRNGKYILFTAAPYRRQPGENANSSDLAPGYWVGAAVADNIWGPYQKQPQVFLGGHIAVFTGPDGKEWFSYRGESGGNAQGRLCVDAISFDEAGAIKPFGPSPGQTVITGG